jgi:hypothetical protein
VDGTVMKIEVMKQTDETKSNDVMEKEMENEQLTLSQWYLPPSINFV